MILTFNEYDNLCDSFSKIDFGEAWFPTVNEIKTRILPNPEPYMLFLIWLSESKYKPETEEDKLSMKLINKILIKHLTLVEQLPERGNSNT